MPDSLTAEVAAASAQAEASERVAPAGLEFSELLSMACRSECGLKDVPEGYKQDRQVVLAAVSQHGGALRFAADECKWDREIVLQAVGTSGLALQYAPVELQGDLQIALEAVRNDWRALYSCPACCKDRLVVMVAVAQDGYALEFASDELRADHEVVLAAVSQNGGALEFASEECKEDRDLVSEAVASSIWALQFAGNNLLEDESFASVAKMSFYLFRVVALSGRSCSVAIPILGHAKDIKRELVRKSCARLDILGAGKAELLHGAATVPSSTPIRFWPGSPVPGKLIEFQLLCVRE